MKLFGVFLTICSTCLIVACGGVEDIGEVTAGLKSGQTYSAKDYPFYGPDCGGKHCQVGDLCVNSTRGQCRFVGQICDQLYHASSGGHGSGPVCGKVNTYYYGCKRGDLCVSAGSRLCRKRTPCKCKATYHSSEGGQGPYCGIDKSNGHDIYLKCQVQDYCYSRKAKLCRKASNCSGAPLYHARSGAKGVKCGIERRGNAISGHSEILQCEKGDTCSHASSNLCTRQLLQKCSILAFTSRPGANPAQKYLQLTTRAKCKAEAQQWFNGSFACGRRFPPGPVVYQKAIWGSIAPTAKADVVFSRLCQR